MEEDDIFQVDKADLIQGPTLAELNANDESLLADLNFDDFLLPTQQQTMFLAGRNKNASATAIATASSEVSRVIWMGFVHSIHFVCFSRHFSAPQSAGLDRFRMAELDAAFSASPSLSHFELQRVRLFLLHFHLFRTWGRVIATGFVCRVDSICPACIKRTTIRTWDRPRWVSTSISCRPI